jgi:uncharacterized protein YjiS (DUF1127 family)
MPGIVPFARAITNGATTAPTAGASLRLQSVRLVRIVVSVIAWLRPGLQRLVAEAHTRRALMKLDDRALKDIGLSRSDIDCVSRALGKRSEFDARGEGKGAFHRRPI